MLTTAPERPASERHAARPAGIAKRRLMTGVIAAPMLPMEANGAVDWTALGRYIAWIAAQGPAAIAMNMDASEGPSLDAGERIKVVEACRAVVPAGCPLFSGLIAGSTQLAIEHGRDLIAAGAEGFVVFPPFPMFMGQPIPASMVVDFHAAIAAALDRPIIAFQFPRGWGPDYTPEMLQQIAAIPQLVALKESSFDAQQTIQTVDHAAAIDNRFAILTGSDTFIFEAMVMGCDGALIGFAGTATREIVRMQECVAAGDIAGGKAIWDRLGPLARHCWRPPIRDYRPRMKEVLVLQGLFPRATCRAPQPGVDDAERAALRRLAQQAQLI